MSQPPYNQPPQGNYPPPPPGNYPQGNYPPPQGNYPPQQGGYPPQQGGYPPQQGGYPPPGNYPPPGAYGAPPPPIKKKRGLGIGGIIGIIILVLFVGGGILYATGILSNVDAPDYPGASKASLTDAGTKAVNEAYDKGKSSSNDRKIFLTGDAPTKVHQFYKDDLTKKGWTLNSATDKTIPNVQSWFEKGDQVILVYAEADELQWAKDSTGKTLIILLTGKKTS